MNLGPWKCPGCGKNIQYGEQTHRGLCMLCIDTKIETLEEHQEKLTEGLRYLLSYQSLARLHSKIHGLIILHGTARKEL